MSESQTCPRRMNSPGPWDRESGLDAWETDRWTTDHEAAQAERDAFMEKHPDGGISPVAGEWIWDGDVPRTCSFCGGIHPEDAIRLVSEHGWEVAATGKRYKRYLNPPGGRAHHEMMMDSIRNHQREGLPGYRKPVPPVKLYTWHFDEYTADRFNAALRASRGEPAE